MQNHSAATATAAAAKAPREFNLRAPTAVHAQLQQLLRDFVAGEVEPQAAKHDREERFNRALFAQAGELGLLGATLPEQYGGAGLDATAAVLIYDALSSSDPGFALAVLAHAILFAQNLALNAGEGLKARLLPAAARGEIVGGLCMTEPAVGTDVLAMKTRARRDGAHYVLEGCKTFITNGGVEEGVLGDAFIVYAATGEREITAFAVEKGMPGFKLGQKWRDKLGMRASFTAELVFEGVRVPAENRLGGEGEGVPQMMRNLESERLTLAAMGVGIGRRALREMLAYAKQRRSFGAPLTAHGQIQRHIGEQYAAWRAAERFVYDTARRLNIAAQGQRVDADAAKLFAAQSAKAAADAAIQVLGGQGYMGENTVERLWRDAKLLEIGGGTLEAHHKNLTKDLCRDAAVLDL